MDAFFAAVEEREKPWLRGSPIVVGADPLGGEGRGVVSTANYKARAYGIYSALPISKAWQFSEQAREEGKPGVIFITPRFGKYDEASKEIVAIVKGYIPMVQVVGADEMYLDFSFTGSYKKAEGLAHEIKRIIRKKTKLTGSIGIGPNKMIAKIASDFQKPDGLTVVTKGKVKKFMAPLPIRSIPGVGPQMEKKLVHLGINHVFDLQHIPREKLEHQFGKWGALLHRKAHGEGSIDLLSVREVQSIGEHETFSVDSTSMKYVVDRSAVLAGDIIRRMKRKGFVGFRTVVLTVRFSDFETKQRSITTKMVMKKAEELELKALKLLLPFFERKENPRKKAVRMIGLRVEKLVGKEQIR